MIWGEEDTALGIELTYGTEAYVEDFTIRYIPHCSHWVQQEKPERVNHYIREFLMAKSAV
jgi:pimeloyl-ACP methyl ester carboxylesterase